MKRTSQQKRSLPLVVAFTLIVLAACTPARIQSPTPPPPTPAPAPAPAPVPAAPPVETEAPPGAVPPDVVDSSEVTFTSEGFNITAYLSKPKSVSRLPGLLIIHENRGLTAHIRDVARRYANQGYVVVAADLLSRVGGRPNLPPRMKPWPPSGDFRSKA